jgi:hypothetical protein
MKSDDQRFYISQKSGYPTPGAKYFEHEYAVVDRQTRQAVAVFIVLRPREGGEEAFRKGKRAAHLRARQHCVSLNRRERLLAVPAADRVAAVRGKPGEGLELDDRSGVRGGDDLPVADVHDDVAATA